VKKAIRQIILGDTHVQSDIEYKRAMLSGQFALLGIVLSIFYIIGDLSQGIEHTYLVYLVAIAVFSFSVFLHRQSKNELANYFLLPAANIVVYLMASSETSNTGTFVFFITTTLAAFVVLGYEHRLLSVFFLAFTFVLFVTAYFVDFSLLPLRHYSDDMVLMNMVVNFSFALPASVMCVYLQVTYNHYNSEQLVASNALLTKANAELDRFVYSTSHDLRAPLSSVLGLINVINNTQHPTDVKKYLGMMKERIHTLDRFIKDITDYSRNNRLEVVSEKVNVNHMVEEIWEMLKYSPEAENIFMQNDLPSELQLDTDRSRLKVILSNLISNSIRYHDASKQDKYIRLRYQKEASCFYLMVEDNGQGIDPQFHQRIFEMFFRANETSKGSGLGLYIVKETLEKLSGSIQLESKPGIGTIFKVALPAGRTQ
jgi:signal transduction histidine kinase